MMSNQIDVEELYLKAMEAYEAEQFTEALHLFTQGADLGYAESQNMLGIMYNAGRGVEVNLDESLRWFKRAWRTERSTSFCMSIAVIYASVGRRRQALYWWKKAVAQDDCEAVLGLAKFLLETNRRKSIEQAVNLLRRAAACQEFSEISPASREEAQALLEEHSSA